MQIFKRHQPEIRGSIFELLLDDVDEVLDLLRWSSPEDKTVPRISVRLILLRPVELGQMLVKDPAGEVIGEDLLFLLTISRDAMGLISVLELLL